MLERLDRLCRIDATLEGAPTTGDPALLERMIANLVDNAIRHNRPNGWIGLRTGTRDGDALFEIANTGPQVPSELLPELFEPFRRAQERLHPARGVGLGLSIAHAIAETHRTVIVAQSRPEGGLEVSVALPRPDEDGLC